MQRITVLLTAQKCSCSVVAKMQKVTGIMCNSALHYLFGIHEDAPLRIHKAHMHSCTQTHMHIYTETFVCVRVCVCDVYQ